MTRIFITGSSTGLGLLAARRLRERGHDVTVHARDQDRARDVRADLPYAPVVIGDLATTTGARDVAAQVSELGRHQAVIHNAAVYRVPRRVETRESLSLTFAVNVLAPYLLIALLPRPDRLVLMTSGLQKSTAPGLDDAQWTRRPWDWMQAYAESKFFDTTMAFAAARRWPSIHANAVSPGWAPTHKCGWPRARTRRHVSPGHISSIAALSACPRPPATRSCRTPSWTTAPGSRVPGGPIDGAGTRRT